eukprot:6194169-Pleurochrysis_carterae.AAC.3
MFQCIKLQRTCFHFLSLSELDLRKEGREGAGEEERDGRIEREGWTRRTDGKGAGSNGQGGRESEGGEREKDRGTQ